jgi:hypothetical protein
MALDSPLAPEAGPVEPPSPYAELVVQLGPAQPWGTAKGKVPPEQAHHLITTFGIVSSLVAGIAGTVLTLRIAAGLTGPAYAELGVACAAAGLIAIRRAVVRAGTPGNEARGIREAFPHSSGKAASPDRVRRT